MYRILNLSILALTLMVQSAFAETAEEPIKVTISKQNWTSQYVTGDIIKRLLVKQGHEVELVETKDIYEDLEAITKHRVDISPEAWETAVGREARALRDLGQLEILSTHKARAREGWYIPFYVLSQCPDLPDWRALNKCAKIFNPKGGERGLFYGPPLAWGDYDDKLTEALNINFDVMHMESEEAIYAKLDEALKTQQPIVIYSYSPHWISLKYPGFFINFPPYASACYTKKSWGINKEKTHDCGRQEGNIFILGSTKLRQKSSKAFHLVRQVHLTEAEIMRMILAIDVQKKPLKEVVDTWMNDHKDLWVSWLVNAEHKAKLDSGRF